MIFRSICLFSFNIISCHTSTRLYSCSYSIPSEHTEIPKYRKIVCSLYATRTQMLSYLFLEFSWSLQIFPYFFILVSWDAWVTNEQCIPAYRRAAQGNRRPMIQWSDFLLAIYPGTQKPCVRIKYQKLPMAHGYGTSVCVLLFCAREEKKKKCQVLTSVAR